MKSEKLIQKSVKESDNWEIMDLVIVIQESVSLIGSIWLSFSLRFEIYDYRNALSNTYTANLILEYIANTVVDCILKNYNRLGL